MRKFLWLNFLSIVILLLVISFVFAGAAFAHRTAITIDSNSNEDLVIRFKDVGTGKAFKSISLTTDSAGIGRTTLETNRDEVDVLVVFVENLSLFLQESNIIKTEEIGQFSTDSEININMHEIILDRRKAEENQSSTVSTDESDSSTDVEDETIEQTDETPEGGIESKITGSTIVGEEGSTNLIYYAIPIGIIILLVIGFIVLRSMRRSKEPKEIKVKKLSELQTEKEKNIQNKEQLIEDAERKIKEAQEDISRIRNEDRIKETKKKLMEDETELRKLEGRED